MEKIPTAESFFEPKESEQGTIDNMVWKDDAIKIAKKFAKLHVEAALKAATKNPIITGYYEEWTKTAKGKEHTSKLVMDDNDNYEGSYSGPVLNGGKVYVVDKASILSAYPLNLIK